MVFAAPRSIIIDAGHGGVDSGVVINGVVEKDICLDISKMLKISLIEKGYQVYLTRELDKSFNKNILKDLKARVRLINKSNANIFLSIHVNAFKRAPDINGSIVFYSSKVSESQKLATYIQNSLNHLSNENRMQHVPKLSHLFVLNKSIIPGVLIETAFASNKQESNLLKTKIFRIKIAKAIESGIEEYFRHNC